MVLEEIDEYILKIDFERKTEHPQRIFKAMSDMIDALYSVDKNLSNSFSMKIDLKLVLQDIETGSIKAKIRTFISSIDDEAIKDLSIRKAIGSFLVKGKHKLIKVLEDKKEIKNIDDIRYLEEELNSLAQETGVQKLPMYCPMSIHSLLKDMSKFYGATSILMPKDSVSFISSEGEQLISQGVNLSNAHIEELLTKELIKSDSEMIFRVKKPDYLGQSMWDVQYKGKTIQVKIADYDWLEKFQNRIIDVRPGDSLRAIVSIEVRYGYDNSVITEQYTVNKVLDVIKSEIPYHRQAKLFKEK